MGASLGAALAPAACFRPDDGLRGLPCTEASSCGGLECSYGVCGGPLRCEAGAGVGDYCFTLTNATYAVGAAATRLVAGQVNLDPYPDLVVGGSDGVVALLLNNGQGDFLDAHAMAPLDAGVSDLAVGRVDSSGWSELVVTTASGSVWVIPVTEGEDGRGAFGTPISVASELDSPSRPQIGAFVDDVAGQADIAVLVANGIDVRAQTGPLTFVKPNPDTFVERPTDIRALGQSMDVIYVAWAGDARLKTYARNPAGSFTERTPIPTGVAAEHFILEDVTDDNYADVLAVGGDGAMWLSRGKTVDLEKAAKPIRVYDLGWKPNLLAAAALDDDADREFVVAGGPNATRADVYLFDNDGDGLPIYGGGLGLSRALAAVVTDIDADGVAELVAIDGESGELRIARRTIAPPPPGGGESTTGGGGMTTAMTTQQDDGVDEVTSTEPPPDPSFPGTEGGESGGLVCDVAIGVSCYMVAVAFEDLPANSRLLFDDLSSDGTADLIAVGDYAVTMIPGFPGLQTNEFDENKRVVLGHDSVGVTSASLRTSAPDLEDPKGVVQSSRVVASYGDAVLEWDQTGYLGGATLPGVRALMTEFITTDVDGFAIWGGLERIGVLDDTGLSIYDDLTTLPIGTAPVLGDDLALYFDENYAALLAVATPGGIATLVPAQAGVDSGDPVPGELWLPDVPIRLLEYDGGGGTGLLIASDGETLYAVYTDGSVVMSLGGFTNVTDLRFADLDGDYYSEIIAIESRGTPEAQLSVVSTIAGQMELVGERTTLMTESAWISDVAFLFDPQGGPHDAFLFFEPFDEMVASFVLQLRWSVGQ